MSKRAHLFYISLLSLIVLISLGFLIVEGFFYYEIKLEERFFHPDHESLKPSGILGHGYGILGSLMMVVGVGIYMARKRWRRLGRLGYLKHWLEFHIFLCTLGPILVLFHTAFKFGGLVAISFWSMVAVFLSGIIGRFIYIQIPRSIEGRELSLNEIRQRSLNLEEEIREVLPPSIKGMQEEKALLQTADAHQDATAGAAASNGRPLREIRAVLREAGVEKSKKRKILRLVKEDRSLRRRIGRLHRMQQLFRYWHVAHLPFAIVMLIVMLIHVVVTLLFGYRWIF